MAQSSAHWMDRVIPDVPVRQWVLSLPFSLRYRAAFDSVLLGQLLQIFISAIFGNLRRRARETGILKGQCGALTVVQRFGSALNLTPHFHVLAFDGVYAAADEEPPRFYPQRSPDRGDVLEVTGCVAERVAALMKRNGEREEPAMAAPYSASVLCRIADGPDAGRKLKTAGRSVLAGEEDLRESFESGTAHCAMVDGFSVNAGVSVRAGDRIALERLCRYVSRPPLAVERLAVLPDGRLSYQLKRPGATERPMCLWRNGIRLRISRCRNERFRVRICALGISHSFRSERILTGNRSVEISESASGSRVKTPSKPDGLWRSGIRLRISRC